LKSYSRPFLGLATVASKQVSEAIVPGALSADIAATNGAFPELAKEEDELVEKEIRDRFKKMCEGYFDNVSKKLVMEHKVGLRLMIAKFAR
jgi:regulator of nonsense transcripts 2